MSNSGQIKTDHDAIFFAEKKIEDKFLLMKELQKIYNG